MKKIMTVVFLLCAVCFAQNTFTDQRDGKTYKAVKIGEQTWMAENLNYAAKDSKCYDDKESNCKKYGRLYDWETSNIVCPSGWHLPTRKEWNVLYDAVGGKEVAAKVLKSKSGWNDDTDMESGRKISGNGEDKFGFTMLPGGSYGGYHLDQNPKKFEYLLAGSCGFFSRFNNGYSYLQVCSDNGEDPNLFGMLSNACSKDSEYSLFSVRCLYGEAGDEEKAIIAKIAGTKAEVAAKAEARAEVIKTNSGNFTDIRDKKTYKTIKIGTQTWMAENLNYNAKGSKCYDNKPVNCDKYGRLYDWNTAMKSCPSGWHLPMREEWDILYDTVGEESIAKEVYEVYNVVGKENTIEDILKSKNGWNYYSWDHSGVDWFGFSALPGGRSSNAYFSEIDEYGNWWGSLDGGYYAFYYKTIAYYTNPYTVGGRGDEKDLFSVRCILDEDTDYYEAKAIADANAKKQAEFAKKQAELEAKAAAAAKANIGTFTDSRDKKTYKTVKIGSQTWMAENLNYNADSSKCHKNEQKNCQKYGGLYDWNTAMKVCPKGWHLPSEEEWQTLFDFAGGKQIAGKKLKARSGWKGNDNGTDIYGFSALPGGYGLDVGCNGSWWSSTECYTSNAYFWDMHCSSTSVIRNYYPKTRLYSVRCIQGDVKAEAKAKIEATRQTNDDKFADPRDKKTYKTIKIGTQTWMAENLNYNAKGSKCYDNKPANCDKYGRLYDWNTAKTACPAGWHLPSFEEWQKLVDLAGSDDVAGKKLKAAGGWNNNGNGTDDYGFAALPGGSSYSGSNFNHLGNNGYWWSAMENDTGGAYYRFMLNESEVTGLNSNSKTLSLSIRCLMN